MNFEDNHESLVSYTEHVLESGGELPFQLLPLNRRLDGTSRPYSASMPSSKPVHPCLPEEFIRQLKDDPSTLFESSYILEARFEKFRREALLLGKDRTPIDIPMVMERPEAASFRAVIGLFPPALKQLQDMDHRCDSFRKEDRKTFLHFAAAEGDIPLAYELVRMGIDLERKDRNGATALFLAVLKAAFWSRAADFVENLPSMNSLPLPKLLTTTHIRKLVVCHSTIATMLIEQHADVNAGAFDVTPLSLAAQSG
ncbi:hypothetical protein BKA70DRAFT_1419910 [Coprinopsis sp. MPI-PUGE-AT-0042]|nr:hypothetical protein BKA70DRAFT_1419910 [Coprinopsis sp. MPI-PUGE-AT-0042]